MASSLESKILAELEQHEEIHTSQLAALLGITRHTTSKYLEILLAKERVQSRNIGNARLWRLKGHAQAAHQELQHSATSSNEYNRDFPKLVENGFKELHPALGEHEALVESNLCLQCGGPVAEAPCMVACPTHIDIPRFIREIRDGDPLASARTIFAANALGGSCARVCPVEELCEGSCVLLKEGRRAVHIGRLQRYATDWALERSASLFSKRRSQANRKSVGVIGCGPASLACAAELAQLGYAVTLYEKSAIPGGLITHGIAPYKQHIEPLPREMAAIEALGVKIALGTEIGRDISIQQLEEMHNAIFMGVGLGQDLSLPEVPARMGGILLSLDFLKKLKLEDHAELLRQMGRRVVVVGGGNTAIDIARNALRLGAEAVHVIYRRTSREMPAYAHEYQAALREGAQFSWLTLPRRFLGGSRLQAIECVRLRLAEQDGGRASKLEPIPGSEFIIETDSAVLAIGQMRRVEFLQQINGLELRDGLIAVNEWGQTNLKNYFAGGDSVNGGSTVVQAVAEGKRAAQGIDRYLSQRG